MKYELRAVNNGWIVWVESRPNLDMPFGEFVFANLREVATWLAERHGEPMPLEY